MGSSCNKICSKGKTSSLPRDQNSLMITNIPSSTNPHKTAENPNSEHKNSNPSLVPNNINKNENFQPQENLLKPSDIVIPSDETGKIRENNKKPAFEIDEPEEADIPEDLLVEKARTMEMFPSSYPRFNPNPNNLARKIPHKISQESFRLTSLSSLIKRDSDLKDIVDNIEKYLTSKEAPDEKLRKAMKILREIAEEEIQLNSPKPKEKFFALVEKHFHILYKDFEIKKRAHKPIIKLLQILDLFIEKDDEDTKKKTVERIHKSLTAKKMFPGDWKFYRKLCDQRENQQLDIHPSWRIDLVEGFKQRIQVIKKALIWKDNSLAVQYAKEMIAIISNLPEEPIFKFLVIGRF